MLTDQQYRQLFHQLGQGFHVIQLLYDADAQPVDYRLIEANAAFERQTGLHNTNGKLVSEVVPGIEPYWLAAYHQVAKTGQPCRMESYNAFTNCYYAVHASRLGKAKENLVAVFFENVTDCRINEQRQTFLLQLTDALRPLGNPLAIEQEACRLLGEHLEADHTYYAEIDVARDYGVIKNDHVRNGEPLFVGEYRVSDLGFVIPLYQRGEPVIVDNVFTSPIIPDADRAATAALHMAWIAVPVVKDGLLVGAFCAAMRSARTWAGWETQLVAETAERVWAAIDRAKADEALRLNEQRFRSFIAASSNLMYRMSADWKQMVNLTSKEHLKNTLEPIDNWIDTYIPRKAQATVWATINKAIELKQTFDLEHQVYMAYGTIGWVHSKAIPILNEQGDITEWIGAGNDITARKKAEAQLQEFKNSLEEEVRVRTAELKESEQLLQGTLDSSPNMIQVFKAVRNDEGQIIDFIWILNNYTSSYLYGDVMHKNLLETNPGVITEGIFKSFVDVTESGIPQRYIKHYVHEQFDGWFHQSVVKLDDGVATSTADISEMKQAEADRLKDLLLLQQSEELARIGSWDYNLQTGVLTWSDGMYRLFELEKEAGIKPEIYSQYATQASRPAAERLVKYLKSGEKAFEEALELEISGHIKVLHIKASVTRDESGYHHRVLGVDMDITAMRRAEEKLQQLKAEQQMEVFRETLNAQEEERRRMSESLHNGLGQLLYGIKISMNNIDRQEAISHPERFNKAKAYTESLMMDAIKESRRISHELMPSTLEEFGLRSAIDDICQQLSDDTIFNCYYKGLYRRLPRYLELAIYRTTQELMLNVVKHAEASNVNITITATKTTVTIEVNDDGKGMPENPSQKTGIGLSSIRNKIKLLNGKVDIQSEAGKGTRIRVIIPNQQI
ncbi:hypothetical protein GCM10027037_27820 [Mucilaginibacter koreensis]